MRYPGLEGKNVLAIGGHSNIGQYVTSLFAASGANVIIGARDLSRAERVATQAQGLEGGKVTVARVDALDESSLSAAIEIAQGLGGLDVLYHGIGLTLPGFFQLNSQEWDSLYEYNFKSVLLALKIALPVMMDRGTGCITIMSSVMGRRPQTLEPVYGALKCAVIHLSQCLALEVAKHGVRINVVAPGPTPPKDFSAISANSAFQGVADELDAFNAFTRELAKEIPLGRMGEPETAAHSVLYLSSPVTGAYHTGQVLGVDGGWWMSK